MFITNMAEKSDGNSNNNGDIFTINEFTECFDLPKWVEVVGGRDVGSMGHGTCNIQKGMILMLRTLAVENVTLSFNDTDTGVKRLVQVSPDTEVKFKVLLPFPDFKTPHIQRTTYEKVSDLLKVCPTYFKAHVFYDDPYLPAIVKSGEVFRFIRQIKRPSDRRIYLQCEDADGNIVELPEECRGDFTAIEDDKSYCLKEILELGPADRKLKLSHDHMKMNLVEEAGNGDKLYCNLTHSDGTNVLQRIMGLPLTYNGLLSYHKPKMFLAASPSDSLHDVWKVPLSVDIMVKEFKPNEYESPRSGEVEHSSQPPSYKMYKLSELLDTFHEDFPVLATLVHYKDIPSEFQHCIEAGSDIVIHDIERRDRILAKSGEMYFSIARDMNGRFRKSLRRFSSIEELKLLNPNSLTEDLYVKVLQEIASDFPVPFSLQTGDVLRFKTLKTKMHKMKVKSKSFGPFPMIQCEKRKESGSYTKIQLPEDLDVCLHEMPPRSKAEGFSAEEVFRFKPEFPFHVDFLPDYTSLWSCLPITSEITLTNFVTEAIAVISPVPKFEQTTRSRSIIDNRVRDCLLVPTRHHMMLTVKECLGFPPGYFMFPDKSVFTHCPVEKVSKQAYEDLIRHNDTAYEDYEYEAGSPVSGMSDIPLPTRVDQKDTAPVNKRLSRSLTNMFKIKPNFLNKLKGRKSSDATNKPTTMAIQNETYHGGSINTDDSFEDNNIYESVNITGKH